MSIEIEAQVPQIPEEAIHVGMFGGKSLYYHDGLFINAATGRHLSITLSPEQHRLFSTFLANKGRFRTAMQLYPDYMENLPPEYVPDPFEATMIITPAVHRLRNTLRQIDSKLGDAIRTKRGRGYRLSLGEE